MNGWAMMSSTTVRYWGEDETARERTGSLPVYVVTKKIIVIITIIIIIITGLQAIRNNTQN